MNNFFETEDSLSIMEEWNKIRNDLYQAYEQHCEPKEFEKSVFKCFTKFARQHSDKTPQFDDFGACFDNVADKREEKSDGYTLSEGP